MPGDADTVDGSLQEVYPDDCRIPNRMDAGKVGASLLTADVTITTAD
jgi:hypothetical protein